MIKLPLVQFLLIIAFVFGPAVNNSKQPATVDEIRKLKEKAAILCMPDRNSISSLIAEEKEVMLLPGSGSYVWKINTSSDSAQLYFNQGINTYYGFHIIESIASFIKAAKFDPNNPMIWWARALAYGPNINDVGYSASPDALEAVKKAIELSGNSTPMEKALISAMEVRYSADTTKSRESLNQLYVDAMKKVYEKFPDSADVVALYADALMLQHPWDLWKVDGTPREWTPRIREALERGLALNDKHPGINHYYIHVMEPSPTPGKAMASADILGTITPGLAHLVHMPSHIYLRTGQFNKGAAINSDALKQFETYNSMFPAVGQAAFLYYWHNQHMLVNCAMHAGKYKMSIDGALDLQHVIDSASLAMPPPMGSLVQYIYMSPVLINVRFAKWDSLLAMKKPAGSLVYANIIYEFGQGMAHAGKNNTAAARKSIDRIDELMKNEDLKIPMTPFSAAIEGARTARELLVGSIHMQEKQYDKAIDHLTQAAQIEELIVYNEPRDWFLNPHQYLGSAYFEAKKYAKAEEVFRKDLTINANNVWSLHGLLRAQEKQNKKKAAAETKNLLKQSAIEADTQFAFSKLSK